MSSRLKLKINKQTEKYKVDNNNKNQTKDLSLGAYLNVFVVRQQIRPKESF